MSNPIFDLGDAPIIAAPDLAQQAQLRLAMGIKGLSIVNPGTGVATALAVNVGSAGAIIVNGGAGGTPSSMTLTNATGLPIATGVAGLASGVATFLAAPTSANLLAALTTKTGTGKAVFDTSPTISGPTINGAATFNFSSVTYDPLSAEAHRNALALSAAQRLSDLPDASALTRGVMTIADKNFIDAATSSATAHTLAKRSATGSIEFTAVSVTGVQTYSTGTTFSYAAGVASTHRAALNLGTLATQNAAAIAVTGGTLDNCVVNNDYRLVDHFIGKIIIASGHFGQLGWDLATPQGLILSSDYNLGPNHPGCPSISCTASTGFMHIFPTYTSYATEHTGVSIEFVFKLLSALADTRFLIGSRNWASSSAETGRRGLFFDAVAGDTVWSLIHETSAGVQTKTATSKTVVVGDWVRVVVKFISGTQTEMTIKTQSSPSPQTVTASAGYSATGIQSIGLWIQAVSGTKIFAPDLAILTVPPQSF